MMVSNSFIAANDYNCGVQMTGQPLRSVEGISLAYAGTLLQKESW